MTRIEGQESAVTLGAEMPWGGLLEHMAEGCAYCQMIFEAGEPQDFLYLAVNSAFERLTGLGNVAGRLVSQVIPGLREADPQVFALYAGVARTGIPAKTEMFVQALDQWFSISVYSPQQEYFVAMFEVITERKRAEVALQQSEQLYRTLVEASQSLVWRCDAEGRFVFLNQAWEQTHGYRVEEMLGRCFGDFQSAAVYARDLEGFSRLMAGGSVTGYETVHLARDGREIELLFNAVAVRDAQGRVTGIQGTALDISRRKRAEETLRRSQAMLARTESIAQVGSWEWEVATDTVTWSGELFRIFGLNSADGAPSFAEHAGLYSAADMARLERAVRAAVTEGTPYELELGAIRPSGETRVCLARGLAQMGPGGTATRLFGSLQDITERKRAEEALRGEQQLSQSILDSLPGIFYLYSYPDNRLLLWNRLHEVLLGYESGEMKGRIATDWFVPEARGAVGEAIDEVMSQGQSSVEAPMVAKDGHLVHLFLTGVRFDAQGEPCFLGIGIDITDRKRAEEEKAILESQLQQAQKMESVGRLAGGIAHDFNNMLGVILGHTELAQAEVDPTMPLYEDLEEIGKAARRSADLTRQLLAFARKQTALPKVLDLNEIVAGMLKMLQRLIGENIAITWLPGAGLWPVKMDPSQLDQILANLCVNARDGISGVGRVTIELGNSTLDEEYCAAHAHEVLPGDYVRLVISDDGCGMDQGVLDHLFEPFFTTKEMGKGTGLGLAMVYGIVKQNRGFIQVRSELDVGTTFALYFPRHGSWSPSTQGSEVAVAAMPGHETILLVEDEPGLLKMTRRMLERNGYTVLAAGTPGQALRLGMEHSSQIDLLITDVVMPEMNGGELAQKLQASYPHLKALFMSGYTADIIAHHGVLDEGVHFLSKPFSRDDLAVKVRAVLDGPL